MKQEKFDLVFLVPNDDLETGQKVLHLLDTWANWDSKSQTLHGVYSARKQICSLTCNQHVLHARNINLNLNLLCLWIYELTVLIYTHIHQVLIIFAFSGVHL